MPSSDSSQALMDPIARIILGHAESEETGIVTLDSCEGSWPDFIIRRIAILTENVEDLTTTGVNIVCIGKAALYAFLQAGVTGPPLLWDSADITFPDSLFSGEHTTKDRLRKRLVSHLTVDGEAVYQLLPCVELFCLAKCILNHRSLRKVLGLPLERLRVNTWHQRLLNDNAASLQEDIYHDLQVVEAALPKSGFPTDLDLGAFLVERATIHILHGLDVKAKSDLEQAARRRGFEFVLTGRLGKRTKYQEKELSQLVVLAKSAEEQMNAGSLRDLCAKQDSNSSSIISAKPQTFNLNDDTLLESVAFRASADSTTKVDTDENIPTSLASIDPGNQPLLQPLDSVILLATASAITNISPQDGLTREETLPYAERVISGGSSNWQVYTQALLVRSRIEGHKSRTIERGVLQLQAVVDQIIAQTTGETVANEEASTNEEKDRPQNSFLPLPKADEAAPASERLKYIHQLASPPRWKLEAELADRWVSLGGLRTALEIYERLQMWAEVALCWAANDREDKARKIIRHQLYNPVVTTSTSKLLEDDEDNDVGDYRIERVPLPADAPRLFCILGDIEKSTSPYERAWEVSNSRFARAQRSLGRYYMASNELQKADEAYMKSLKVAPQNHPTWFALGCIRLQLEYWQGAVDAFGRAVQIDDSDAESWSNLAVALLRLSPSTSIIDADAHSKNVDAQRHIREAFVALKKAATLKRDSFRIWQNVLSVSVKLVPPPYSDIIVAQSRLIDLLSKAEGEKCIDIPIVEALVAHVIAQSADKEAEIDGQTEEPKGRAGLEKMVVDLVQKKITPLITASRRLWLLTAKLNLYLQRPLATLSAYEKAWRSTLNQPEWETALTAESARKWKEVADATIELIDAYESLGERNREFGMGEGEMVCKDWKFKSRSATRTVLARAKEGWEGDEAYELLKERLHDIKVA